MYLRTYQHLSWTQFNAIRYSTVLCTVKIILFCLIILYIRFIFLYIGLLKLRDRCHMLQTLNPQSQPKPHSILLKRLHCILKIKTPPTVGVVFKFLVKNIWSTMKSMNVILVMSMMRTVLISPDILYQNTLPHWKPGVLMIQISISKHYKILKTGSCLDPGILFQSTLPHWEQGDVMTQVFCIKTRYHTENLELSGSR